MLQDRKVIHFHDGITAFLGRQKITNRKQKHDKIYEEKNHHRIHCR